MVEVTRLEICLNRDDAASMIDMLRYDAVKIKSVVDAGGKICVEGETTRVTPKRWESFGIKPKIVSTRRDKADKVKNYNQDGEICVTLEDKDMYHPNEVVEMLNEYVNKDVWITRFAFEVKDHKIQMCMGAGGEKSKVIDFLKNLKSKKIEITRKPYGSIGD
jgi:hypothetical protein